MEAGWTRLESTYADRGLVLALGAGVSVGCGLPNWTELLSRVAELGGLDRGRNRVTELRSAGFSLPAIAASIKASCREPSDFAELVRKALYARFPAELRNSRSGARLVAFVQRNNSTLRAVAALCALPAQQNNYRRNERVHGILNFNSDAVLRAYVRARYGEPLLIRTVERPSKSSNPAKINVYHLHGFLRFDSKAGNRDKEASDKLVLTEQEYFDFFNSPMNLFTYTFLHLLREHSCLFIGLSMHDDNIRRLLHYSAKERARGYEEEGGRFNWTEKVVRHFTILSRPDRREVREAMERSLLPLGVRVLWVSTYDEIPERLGRMYSSGDAEWRRVF